MIQNSENISRRYPRSESENAASFGSSTLIRAEWNEIRSKRLRSWMSRSFLCMNRIYAKRRSMAIVTLTSASTSAAISHSNVQGDSAVPKKTVDHVLLFSIVCSIDSRQIFWAEVFIFAVEEFSGIPNVSVHEIRVQEKFLLVIDVVPQHRESFFC